ncbi:MAG: transcriptional regulator [Nitrospira sp.]|nr:transcriptional regulator [Nitrospira sp.]
MIPTAPADSKKLNRLLKQGEGPTLEFKRSTGELREGLQTICAFLNGLGGMVLFGVRPDGKPEGQHATEQTLREIAHAMDRFEPPVNIPVERIQTEAGRAVLVLRIEGTSDTIPFTFEGRPYERVGNTTRKMAQDRYEQLLFERSHSKRRWENQPAHGISLKDIDREEVFRIVEIARSVGRLVGPVGKNLPDVLNRLGLRQNGQILRAAVVLFGKTFLPDYPQCELRMARFRGTDKTEFLDQRQIRGPAFKLLEEAELFCQRHFPLPAKIVPGRMRRVETPLIPPDAMREILVNALIHRDYSIAGGAVSLAIFNDRVEVWSAGVFPKGITPESLMRPHLSVQRNPILADIFHRTGLIEKWGRGTDRVVDMCREGGIPAPIFEEITGAAVVTFRVNVAGPQQLTLQVGTKSAPSQDQVGTKSGLSRDQVEILRLCREAQPLLAMMEALERQNRTKFRDGFVKPLIKAGLLELTIPDKPQSRLQKYRLTEDGAKTLKTKRE